MSTIRLIILLIFLVANDTITLAQIDNDTMAYSVDSANNEDSDEQLSEEIDEVDDQEFYRTIDSIQWEKIKSDKDFIYTPEKIEQYKKNKSKFDLSKFFNASLFKWILIFLVIGFIILIAYFLFANSDFSYFKRRQSKLETLSIEDWNQVATYTEWEKALQQALQNEDYRLAIRIHYLELLHILDKKSMIQFQTESTNWDYVNQMSKSDYAETFTKLTKYFDYIWYGTFVLNQEKYLGLQKEFQQLKQILA